MVISKHFNFFHNLKSIKSIKYSNSNNSKRQYTSNSIDCSISTNNTNSNNIAKLSQELLLCIYQQLDTLECTKAFSITCKSFRKIATQPRSKAAQLATRYGPRFAIYYALLSIPERCTAQFLQYMFGFGAQVPHCLVQILVQTYGKPIDTIVKPFKTRRRSRSSFDTFDLDLLFLKSIQLLPFHGYLTILNRASNKAGYREADVYGNDLVRFLASLVDHTNNKDTCWKDMIYLQMFFPVPILTANEKQQPFIASNYRHILRLTQTSPDAYNKIAPLFDFDPFSRSLLWESILSLFFDEAFRSSKPTKERELQFEFIEKMVMNEKSKRHVQLVGPLTDQQIFCQTFVSYFAKYPVGYFHQKAMMKLLGLVKTYVKPNFKIDTALEHMVHAQIGRNDTIEMVDKFLKSNNEF